MVCISCCFITKLFSGAKPAAQPQQPQQQQQVQPPRLQAPARLPNPEVDQAIANNLCTYPTFSTYTNNL